MDILKRPILNRCSKEEILRLRVNAPDLDVYKKILKNFDKVAKPLDALGRFEGLIARIGAILGTENIDISRKAVIVMCADNGIVKEGISQSGQEVTLAVAKKMADQSTCVGKMAKAAGADTMIVDIGINSTEKIPGILDKKICRGTKNFREMPAMTEEETIKAICTGMEMVYYCKERGYKILATGEMGIGNTTTSSAVAAALLGCAAAEVTGRGAGLTDEKLAHKIQVIDEALEKYKLRGKNAIEILQTVGGLDIAGLAGVCIGGAVYHVPIVLDGMISMAAALLAERMVHGTKDYLLASHMGKEPAAGRLASELALEPVIYADMALGEGTGAVMMFSLLDMALGVYKDSAVFSDVGIGQYERFEGK